MASARLGGRPKRVRVRVYSDRPRVQWEAMALDPYALADIVRARYGNVTVTVIGDVATIIAHERNR